MKNVNSKKDKLCMCVSKSKTILHFLFVIIHQTKYKNFKVLIKHTFYQNQIYT